MTDAGLMPKDLSGRSVLVRVGRVLVVWALAIAVENVVVGFGYRALFAGYWEMAIARETLSPLLLTALVPAALAVGLFGEIGERLGRVDRAEGRARARTLYAGAAFFFGVVAALSVSTGRHTRSWGIRVPFMLVVGACLFVLVRALAPRLAKLADGARVTLGALAAVAFWMADSFVLTRLYAGFHLACLALMLVALALVAEALPKFLDRVGLATLAVAVALVFYAPRAARAGARSDNLRFVLLEKAPLLGRAVWLASRIAPGEAPSTGTSGSHTITEVPRALDWTGKDLVLVTVDALRADHVSSYGYSRTTTPAIDALAARGTRFAHAYCPTPHTSYSVTSMLTGKYVKPLLALGALDGPGVAAGEGSETFASHMRRYGYRTAAFYPPAVFFIDEARFTSFRDSGLGFEYRKVEFAERELRVEQIRRYLQSAPKDRPLFLWVHLFEPHEPYVLHGKHPFGAEPGKRGVRDLDAYDSEIAEADQTIGEIVRAMDEMRPGATFVVTADHGEEFGEHGGRYHGTTVYEEQVRVPLVIAGKDVKAQTANAPVQTIDLLPTALSALGIPRPARVRGRDLGKILRDGETTEPERRGFAFAETDDYTLVAEGDERLVCARKVGACALYDVGTDPNQTKDVGAARAATTRAMRARLAETERDHGRYENGVKMPDALRRGKQGEVDAAEDVAALFDDASPAVRREAAEVAFLLNRGVATANGARRALAREDDEPTRRFLALTLVRANAPDPAARAAVVALFDGTELAWKRRAALALADGGDARGVGVLAAWLDVAKGEGGDVLELDRAREIVALLARYKAKVAVPSLVGKLSDLRLRPYVVDALGAIGDPSARGPLLAAFAVERYRPTRAKLADALVATGAKDEMFKVLTLFAGMPEPLETSVVVAARAGLLTPKRGGLLVEGEAGVASSLAGVVNVPHGPFRVLVEARGPGEATVLVDGKRLVVRGSPPRGTLVGTLSFTDGEGTVSTGSVRVEAFHPAGVFGVLLVPVTEELAPPPREAWDGGASEPDDDGGLSADAKAE